MKTFRFFLVVLLISSFKVCTFAQLVKTEMPKELDSYYNYGSPVSLFKDVVEEDTVYALTLCGIGRFDRPFVFWLGKKDKAVENLTSLSEALKNGKKGEKFEFYTYAKKKYILYYHTNFGYKLFTIHNDGIIDEYADLYDKTINKIIAYIKEEE